jgi:hypothetical protein
MLPAVHIRMLSTTTISIIAMVITCISVVTTIMCLCTTTAVGIVMVTLMCVILYVIKSVNASVVVVYEMASTETYKAIQ